jgi:hypothetical protein
MSMYLNCRFDDGERLALEIGTPKGVSDFTTWAKSLPSEFALVRRLAVKGEAPGSKTLREQLLKAIKTHKPNASARAVAERIHDVFPHEGTTAIADEPDDSEMDEE